MTRIQIAVCGALVFATSAFAADPPKAGAKKLTYQENVQPILREKCFAFEGWILGDAGQKGLSSLAFWHALESAVADDRGYAEVRDFHVA